MAFSREMLEAKKALEQMGHDALVPVDVIECLENPDLNMNLEHCISTRVDKKCFDLIAESDAIVVLNHKKNGIKGYIGGATLMEIGIARHFNKKIFLLHELPSEKEQRYVLEIKTTEPIVLNGDLAKIGVEGNRKV